LEPCGDLQIILPEKEPLEEKVSSGCQAEFIEEKKSVEVQVESEEEDNLYEIKLGIKANMRDCGI
jgi:hypothetical protein